jgi:hypothetical protein
VSPRAGPPPAGRAGRGGGDVATLVREDRHRLLGSLPLQRARSRATGNGGSSSDLWGAHPPPIWAFLSGEKLHRVEKFARTHYGTAGAARTPVGQRSPVSSRFSFFWTISQARRKSKICAGKKKSAAKNQNKNEGSSSAIAAKIVRVMLAALRSAGPSNLEPTSCSWTWMPSPLGKILSKYYRRRTPSATHCSR